MDIIWVQAICAHKPAISLSKTHNSPQLMPLIENVEKLLFLAQEYYETSNSIYWNKASPRLKRFTRQKLEKIAWDALEALDRFPFLFNNWCDEQQKLNAPLTSPVFSLKFEVNLLREKIEKYWGHHLHSRQLELFEPCGNNSL